MKIIVIELKQIIIDCYNNQNKSLRELSKLYNVSKSAIGRWVNGVNIIPTKRNIPLKITPIISTFIVSLLPTKCIIKDMMYQIKQVHNVDVSICSIWRHLKSLKYTMKLNRKKTTCDKNSAEKKQIFKSDINSVPIEDIYSLDEVGFQVEMYPRKGWSQRGTRCTYESTIKGYKNITGVFMISTKGVVSYNLSNKATNKDTFLVFLKNIEPSILMNKTLVMDNLCVHHTKDITDYLSSIGVRVKYTPPYSPELNPIEEMFSWTKRKLRYKHIKTSDQLKVEITNLVAEINNEGLKPYFTHAYL